MMATLDNITENTKILAKDRLVLYELKRHKPWFDDGCWRFFFKRSRLI
jgi:hypothetical protein